MRCVITGTRDGRADLWYWMRKFVERRGVPELWILGDARGVDSDARELCRRMGWAHRVYYADWRPGGIYDVAAGFKRNREMVLGADPGDFCLAFPSAGMQRTPHGLWVPVQSRGTEQCLKAASARELHVFLMPHVRKIRAGEGVPNIGDKRAG